MAVAHPVLKVLTSDQWDALQRHGETAGAPVDLADGYVHLSTPAQVGETIAKHFRDEDLLYVLTLDGVELGEALRWEPSRGGQDFPHLYRPLRMADVRGVRRLSVQPRHQRPERERYLDLDSLPRDGDERTMIEGLLDWYRDGVAAKVAGLTDEQARQRHVTSQTTIVGLVKHLAMVEDHWFPARFAGGEPQPDWADIDWDATPDWEFESARDQPLSEVLDHWREAVTRSRAIAAASGLDDVSRGHDPDRGPFTLRWLLLHLLEEYARHLGHLDVLRELTDGTTGE